MLGVTFVNINTVYAPLFRTLESGANLFTCYKSQIKVTESVCSNTEVAALHLQGINLTAKHLRNILRLSVLTNLEKGANSTRTTRTVVLRR